MDCDWQSLFSGDGDIEDVDLLAAAEAAAEFGRPDSYFLDDCEDALNHSHGEVVDLTTSPHCSSPIDLTLSSSQTIVNLTSLNSISSSLTHDTHQIEHQYHGWISPDADWDNAPTPTPFLRPPIPRPIQPSPIIPGLTASHSILSAFRIYEAIRIFHRCGPGSLVELFAQIHEGWEFRDIYHGRKPWIIGVWVGQADGLWEFQLHGGDMVRAMGRMVERDRMEVVGIRGASWGDLHKVRSAVGG